MNDRDVITRGIHTDCLLNYETVKYFGGEQHEGERGRERDDRGQHPTGEAGSRIADDGDGLAFACGGRAQYQSLVIRERRTL